MAEELTPIDDCRTHVAPSPDGGADDRLHAGPAAVLSLTTAARACRAGPVDRPASHHRGHCGIAAAVYKRVDTRALEGRAQGRTAPGQPVARLAQRFLCRAGPAAGLAGLVWSGNANGIALMAAGTVTIGAAAVLASLLWYDR
jgi:hypothetical protein